MRLKPVLNSDLARDIAALATQIASLAAQSGAQHEATSHRLDELKDRADRLNGRVGVSEIAIGRLQERTSPIASDGATVSNGTSAKSKILWTGIGTGAAAGLQYLAHAIGWLS